MMRDIFEAKGELLRAYAKLIWHVLSLLIIAAALGAMCLAFFEGVDLSDRAVGAIVCGIVLLDMLMTLRDRRRRKK